jgi:hypothetical protein
LASKLFLLIPLLNDSLLGSGKTAAFLVPTISKLIGKVKKLAAPRPNLTNGFNPGTDVVRAEPLILVIAPTRELACQIFDEARRLCYRTMLRPCVVYGGGPVREQREELQKGCDILIATPGRLKDFMDKPHILSLNRVRYVYLVIFLELLLISALDTPSLMRQTSSYTTTGVKISRRSCLEEILTRMLITGT